MSRPMSVLSFTVASLLSVHGFWRRSLSAGGACLAFCIGFVVFSSPLHAFSICLLVFYFIGSWATKRGKLTKARLEDDFQESGCRTASQVLCNSFAGVLSCLLWGVLFVPNSFLSSFVADIDAFKPIEYNPDIWCPLSRDISEGWSRALLFASLGHFACCLGDTLASELGILSHSPPVLITTFQTVYPGTHGAVSLGGILASLGGGGIIGITLAASLILESSNCRDHWIDILIPLSIWGFVAGGLGSLIDSLLGATLQKSCYSPVSKRILKDTSSGPGIEVISGRDILTNNQVNLVSSTLTAVILARFG